MFFMTDLLELDATEVPSICWDCLEDLKFFLFTSRVFKQCYTIYRIWSKIRRIKFLNNREFEWSQQSKYINMHV